MRIVFFDPTKKVRKKSHHDIHPPQLLCVGIGDLRTAICRARHVPVVIERDVVAVELDLALLAPRGVLFADKAVSLFVRKLGAA